MPMYTFWKSIQGKILRCSFAFITHQGKILFWVAFHNFHEIKYDSTIYLLLIFNTSDDKSLEDFLSELSKDFDKGLGLNVYLLHDAGKLHTLCMKNCTMNAKWSCKSSIFIINFVFSLTKNKVLKSSSTYTVHTWRSI